MRLARWIARHLGPWIIRPHLARWVIKLQPAGPVRRQPPVDALDVVHVHALRQPPHHLPFTYRAEAHSAILLAGLIIRIESKGRKGLHREWVAASCSRAERGASGVLGRGAGAVSPPPPATERDHCDQDDGERDGGHVHKYRDEQCARRLRAARNAIAHDDVKMARGELLLEG
jgi:hypothetical protein